MERGQGTSVHTVSSEEETLALARALGKTLLPGDLVAYRGGMGMGKTLFTRGLAAGMGLDPALTASPTFTLMHEYRNAAACLWHFDMYRISGEENLASTGFFDCLGAQGALAVEWSENIAEFLPEDIVTVLLEPGENEHSRRITITDRRRK